MLDLTSRSKHYMIAAYRSHLEVYDETLCGLKVHYATSDETEVTCENCLAALKRAKDNERERKAWEDYEKSG